MENTSCLVVFESSMHHRYAKMAGLRGFQMYNVGLENNWQYSFLNNMTRRIRSKKVIKKKLRSLHTFIERHHFDTLYLSNAEGYISKNFIHYLKRKFPDLKLIALQHGIFPLRHFWLKETVRNGINTLAYVLTGIFPLGAGFGGIKLDGYYVYSEREKEFLVEKKGWSFEGVVADIKFIKPEVYNQYLALQKGHEKKGSTAVFLLQGLHLAGLCTMENEMELIKKTIEYISVKYERVLLKEHPACKGRLGQMTLPGNVLEEEDLFVAFSKANDAYSFFSTALIDAKIFNLKAIGIRSDKIKVDNEIYDNFDINIDFEETIAP